MFVCHSTCSDKNNEKVKNKKRHYIPSRMLLGLEQGVKVPEGALYEVVGGHLGEAHLKEDLPVLCSHLASNVAYHKIL